MRSLLSLALVTAWCGLALADEPKLELSLHELAGVARKAGLKKLVVVSRLDASSAQATNEELDRVEQLAVAALSQEKDVDSTTSDKASIAARQAKVRRALTVEDSKPIKDAAACDAVVALDYREAKDRSTVRVALSDGQRIHFADTVPLKQKISDQPFQKVPAGNAAAANQAGPAKEGLKGGPIGGNGGQFMQAPPPGASGYAIATNGGNPNYVRKPSSASSDAGAKAGAGGKAEGGTKAGGLSTSTSAGGKKSSTDRGNAGGGASAGGAAGGGVAVAGTSSTPAQPGAAATEVGQRILQFATSHLGQQVGNGECWTLAADAMRAAGAQPPDGYTFGDEIPLRSMRPGDILQFTTARFDEPGYYAIMGAPNHTAVVYSTAGDRVFMLHQNFNGKRTVSTFDFNLASLSSGRIQAFRPRPR